MFCIHCGFQLSGQEIYCPGCGRLVAGGKGKKPRLRKPVIVCILLAVLGLVLAGILLHGSAGAQIKQVLPIDDGSVAVLYTDGTVEVSPNAQFYGKVSDWTGITRLYCKEDADYQDGEFLYTYTLVGLTEGRTVRTTAGDLAGWTNIEKLYFPYEGIVGVTGDGRVLTREEKGELSFLEELTNVEALVCGMISDIWGCLKKDGTVYLISSYTDPDEIRWTNVKELRDSGHAFYVLKEDGSVDGGLYESYAGLQDAVKVVHYNDCLFGISGDGRLLTHSGGNIYTNYGSFMVDKPGVDYYAGEVDIRDYDQVKDILSFDGLILVNEDGTVDTISAYPEWDLSSWTKVDAVYGYFASGPYISRIYGIRRDGSVIVARYDWETETQTITDHYRDWSLQEIYVAEDGIVALTTDGKLVGEGIYEWVDFSVFDR